MQQRNDHNRRDKANLKVHFAYSFADPSATGVIDEPAKTVAVTVPYGTDVKALVASFVTTGEGGVTVNGTPQASGVTANDFSNPVPYTVTAEDGSTATYTVTVTVAPSFAKAITAFSFRDAEFAERDQVRRIAGERKIHHRRGYDDPDLSLIGLVL